ncbi:Muellerian-inhibiting factor [Merluccius polli]|uniref:Muellerian-inhibiting factor n=1 Tax=Merluccius polli TaxID=89951 RepID=A0AA47MYL7_MERPO|nr:Muellerian-inhibiting factor [Merluccius polli]
MDSGGAQPETPQRQLRFSSVVPVAETRSPTDAVNPGGADTPGVRDDGDVLGASPRRPGNACLEGSQGRDLLSDLFAALRVTGGGGSSSSSGSSSGSSGGQGDPSAAPFGVCTNSGMESTTALMQLRAKGATCGTGNQMDVLQPITELLGAEGERLILTLAVPESPLLTHTPTVLLAFDGPLMAKDLDVAFTGPHLHPNTQSVCISEETRYVILTGRASEEHHSQKWSIFLETKSPDAAQKLQEILIGGGPGSKISMTPLLLFLSESGPDIRSKPIADTAPLGSADTFSFLSELHSFLGDVSPRTPEEARSSPVQLQSLPSLPPLALGLSSGETVLTGLLNSFSPTVFSFPTPLSVLRRGRGGELALPPHQVEELRQKLRRVVEQVLELMGEVVEEEDKEVEQRAIKSLERLEALSAFPKEDPPAGERQYRAFLLLKALQTVARAYEVQRGLRAARAGQGSSQAGANLCGLQSLTVALDTRLVGPDTAAINNCHGVCGYPLHNGNNHAILLNQQIQSGRALDRSLCCVPVAYDDMQVVELVEGGTYMYIKPNMVAKQCGCR